METADRRSAAAAANSRRAKRLAQQAHKTHPVIQAKQNQVSIILVFIMFFDGHSFYG